jgi:cytochrome c-type biogenesis protein CcmH/NrfG
MGIVRSYNAELLFYSSLQYAQANNGSATYNTQILTIRTNPYISRYHIIFSQTNLALAASLANSIRANTTPQTKGLADTTTKDRQLVAQLLQQAINEAKKAVALDPVNILSWENLARTYQQLIGVAQGADNWTVASYNQAIQLDPTNPVLYVDLGTVFMSINNYTTAITEFQRAIALKSDYANAYYNLANAYKSNNDITQAIATIKQVLPLIDKSSDDYKVINQTLSDYGKEASGSSTVSSATYNTLPSATIQPKPITLPTVTLPAKSTNQVTK